MTSRKIYIEYKHSVHNCIKKKYTEYTYTNRGRRERVDACSIN